MPRAHNDKYTHMEGVIHIYLIPLGRSLLGLPKYAKYLYKGLHIKVQLFL